jgi:hypothetical protein
MDHHKDLHADAQIVEVALIYDSRTGDILGSHTFATASAVTEDARRRFEALLEKEVAQLEQRHGRKLAVHRSEEARVLKSLHHRMDVASGRLVGLGAPPVRLKVE